MMWGVAQINGENSDANFEGQSAMWALKKNSKTQLRGPQERSDEVHVFRLPSVALQEKRFCASCTRKPRRPPKNLLKTTQGS